MADPVSPSDLQHIDKDFWDAEVYQRWVDLLSPWTSYTPTWFANVTAVTVGNATLDCRYKLIGKTVLFQMRIIWGSTTSSPAGAWQIFRPPVAPSGYISAFATAKGIPFIANVVSGFLRFQRHDGALLSSTVPSAWVTPNEFHAFGFYEAA